MLTTSLVQHITYLVDTTSPEVSAILMRGQKSEYNLLNDTIWRVTDWEFGFGTRQAKRLRSFRENNETRWTQQLWTNLV